MSSVMHFSGLYKTFGKRTLLHNAELKLHSGECIELQGKNGAGKSTLLKILAGLEKPDKASVSIDDLCQSWRKSRKHLQSHVMYLHQQPYMFDGTVYYNLSYPIKHLPQHERNLRIHQALEWAELKHLLNADANTLSGGEKQRVALARAWLHQPEAMLLDEPTANLDTSARLKTVQLLNLLKQQGIALMIASHDSGHFHSLFDQTYLLEDARIKPQTSKTLSNVTPINQASA